MNGKNLEYLFDMCTNGRFVTNRFTGQQFWANCGHCKSCLQEKAASRANRIRHEYDGKSQIYFGTLTYDRLSAPFFYHKDFLDIKSKGYGELKVYRRHSIKWSVNKQRYYKIFEPVELCSVPLENLEHYGTYMPYLSKQFGCVGVCYYKDVQDFYKRFRQQLKLHGYNEKIKLFTCSEYGAGKVEGKGVFRPHFHFLLFAPNGSQAFFHSLVCKSWAYGNRIRDPKSFQLVTDDPAGYVASYVNCGQKLPHFLADYFKPKHSSSKLFGHGLPAFSLSEIEKKVATGTLNYVTRRTGKHGDEILDFPLPKYVINRFFPLFKGYSRLSSDTVFDFLSSGFDVSILRRAQLNYDWNNPKYPIDYRSVDFDLTRIRTRFLNVFDTYKSVFPDRNFIDYALDYQRTWNVWKSTCFKYFRTDDEVPDFYKFDNMCLQPIEVQKDFFIRGCRSDMPFIVDNNRKPNVVAKTLKMAQTFDKYDKQKAITGTILREKGVMI